MTPRALLPEVGPLAYTFKQAADGKVVPFSETTLRRAAFKPSDDGQFPPPLNAKRDSKGRLIVLRTELQRWLESLQDA